MDPLRDFLRATSLFRDLEDELVDRVIGRLEWAVYDTGETICRQGDAGEQMYIVVDGEVSVFLDLEWGRRELERMGDGEAFGEMSLLCRQTRSATVVATRPTACVRLDRVTFQHILDDDPHVAQRIAQTLTRRMSALHESTTEQIVGAYRALLFTLADLAESRNPRKGAHLEHTRRYCALLAEKLRDLEAYRGQMGEGFAANIYHVAPLHDVGTVAVPDRILLKPGPLTDPEYRVVRQHPEAGARALASVIEYSDREVFHMAERICRHHHERWDGTGYPDGLSGTDIPLEARIMAVADVYDALRSKLVYKSALSPRASAREMERVAGMWLDPAITAVLLSNIEEFEAVRSVRPRATRQARSAGA